MEPWLYLRERYLSHRVLDDYDAVLERSAKSGTEFATRQAVSQD
jgi:hypothetical protein